MSTCLEKDVFFAHTRDRRNDAGVGGIVLRVEHVEPLLLILRRSPTLMKFGSGVRENSCVST